MDAGLQELIDAAQSARQNAYAPYSGYAVGCAIRDEAGRIHLGCNVENASYGLTFCAERAALAGLVASGAKEVAAVAVATEDGGTPCGMCRQSLVEFASTSQDVPVICIASVSTAPRVYSLAELLPQPFVLKEAGRT